MAIYQSETRVKRQRNPIFDTQYNPGSKAIKSGIYYCTGCGYEIVVEQDHQFPSENHPIHRQWAGAIRWQLLVCTALDVEVIS